MPSLTSTCLLTVAARPSPKLPARYFPTSLCHSKRGKNRVCTICKSYHELRSAAEGAYERARSLLPELERAQAIAAEARDPASEAERRWQDAHGRLVAVQGGAHEAIQEVRARALRALGGSDHLIDSMLRHHTAWRVQNFRQKSPSASSDTVIWSECPPNVTPLTWLPGAAMLAHSLIMVKDGFPYLIASIAVATPPFATSQQDSLRSLLLHWSVADGPGAGWANSIPQGWHTSPGISHPCGSTAWQTHFAPYTPVLGHSKEGINGVTVFSVIVQIPMEGFLESRGGLKFVLKRSDGGQPEWIKPANNADFWLDFEPSIAALTAIKQKLEDDETENIAQTAGDPDVDSIDEWGWARILTAGTANTAAEMDFPGLTNVSDQNACAWLCAVSRWAEVPSTNGDVSTSSIPEQHHSLSKQMEQLRTILAAELDFTKDQTHSTIDEKVKDGKDELIKSKVQEIESLLQRCNQVDGALQRYDLASLEARKEQVDKERLWDIYKNASNEASRLEAEAAAVVQEARQSVAALRGRSNPPQRSNDRRLGPPGCRNCRIQFRLWTGTTRETDAADLVGAVLD